MVSDVKTCDLTLDEARTLRDRTQQLLNRLTADRDQLERRQAESGRRDPLKVVTGRSALDNAVDAARQMLEQIEATVLRFEAGSAAPARRVERPTVEFDRQVLRRSFKHPARVNGKLLTASLSVAS